MVYLRIDIDDLSHFSLLLQCPFLEPAKEMEERLKEDVSFATVEFWNRGEEGHVWTTDSNLSTYLLVFALLLLKFLVCHFE